MARAVFLTGYWRSGTNGTVAALGKHREIAIYNENNSLAFQDWKIRELETLKNIYHNEVNKLALFKPVSEPYRIPEYLDLEPNTQVIYLYRNAESVCRSGLKNFETWPKIQRNFLKDFFKYQTDIFHQYDFGLAERVRQELEYLYDEKLSNASIIVLRWIISNKFYLKSQYPYDSRTITVSYESLTEHPELIFTRICNFLGLEFTSEIIADIKPSKRHQFRISLNEEIKLAANKCYQELDSVALSLQSVS